MRGSLPVERSWFRAHEVAPGLTRLVEPFVDPLLESNVWHLRGRDADLVVDAGNGIGPLLPDLAPLAQDRPIIAVATHGHFDHTGGLHEFEDRRCHAADADDVRRPFALRLVRERFEDGTEEIFRFYGFTVPDVVVRAVPREGFDLEGWSTPGADPSAFLDEGDRIDLGDRSLEVLHVPGHTAGSIALWESATGTLFTGDAAYVDDLLSWDDEEDFVASLARLTELPAERVCAGHGRVFGADELRALSSVNP